MIELDNVSRRFTPEAEPAVDCLSLSVPEQSLTVLLGESGCGKTTTLKMINRLIEPDSGSVRVGGIDVAAVDPVELRRGIGYVFQGIGLFPHLTVATNAGLVPTLLGWSAAERQVRVDEVLELVGLPPGEFATRLPAQLSGGQRQRVGFARALAARPQVLLMDEPFGALDPLTRAQLQDELLSLRDRLGLTILMVTHDMTEAVVLADQLAVMQRGRLVACGSPAELMQNPSHPYAADLLQAPQRQAAAIERIRGAGTAHEHPYS